MSFGFEQLFLDGSKPAKRSVRVLRGVLVAVFSLAVVAIAGSFLRDAIAHARWQPTPCRVTASGVSRTPDNAGSAYTFNIAFDYSFGGRSYTSDLYAAGAERGNDAAAIYALCRSFPVGRATTCYLDPADPGRAVLKLPDVRTDEAATAVVAVVAFGLIVFYSIPQIARPAPPPGRTSRFMPVYLVLFTAGCWSALAWTTLIPLVQTRSAESWAAVPCTIEHAGLIAREMHGELPITTWRTDVLYRYTVAGIEYHSNQYSPTEINSPFAAGRQKRVNQLAAVGSPVCYVDPRHPDSSVLTRRVSPTQWIASWIALMALLGTYLMIPRRLRSASDGKLQRSRWTITAALIVLAAITVWGELVMP